MQTRAEITGWGKCVPPVSLSNADLERLMDLAPGFWDDLQLELREAGVEAFAPVNPVKEGAE